MRSHLTFLSHWVLCLIIFGIAFFAYHWGVFQTIWVNDASYMTSAIAALVIGTMVWLGWQAWKADSQPIRHWVTMPQAYTKPVGMTWPKVSADFGHDAQFLAPSFGMLGTVIGLSMQAKALVAGAAGLGALSTSLFTTGAGIAGVIILKVLTMNLEAGIRRNER